MGQRDVAEVLKNPVAINQMLGKPHVVTLKPDGKSPVAYSTKPYICNGCGELQDKREEFVMVQGHPSSFAVGKLYLLEAGKKGV